MFGDSPEDGVCVGRPHERPGIIVAVIQVLQCRGFQRRHTGEHAASQLLLGEIREDSLHLIQPACAGRREVQVILRMAFEPALHRRRLVRDVVVQHDVHARAGRLGGAEHVINGLEELDELLMSVTPMALADHHAGLDHEGREQAAGAVPVIVVRATLGRARPHGQEWLRAIQGLHLALLIDAQDHRVLRRAHVQPGDVAHLLDEVRIPRELERLAAVRLQIERPPDRVHAGTRDAAGCRHRTQAPVRGVDGLGFQRHAHHFGDLLIADRPLHARPGLVLQAGQPMLQKAAAPLEHRLLAHVQLGPDGGIGHALLIQQHHFAPRRQCLSSAGLTHQASQFDSFFIAHHQRRSCAHRVSPEYSGNSSHTHAQRLRHSSSRGTSKEHQYL